MWEMTVLVPRCVRANVRAGQGPNVDAVQSADVVAGLAIFTLGAKTIRRPSGETTIEVWLMNVTLPVGPISKRTACVGGGLRHGGHDNVRYGRTSGLIDLDWAATIEDDNDENRFRLRAHTARPNIWLEAVGLWIYSCYARTCRRRRWRR